MSRLQPVLEPAPRIEKSATEGRVMEYTLNGRKALVTGGAGGIGAASVRALAAQGAKVVIADVDAAAAEALADEVGGTTWAVDLLDVDSLTTLSLDCDILVNNAGIQRISPIEDFEPADFRRLITLMLEVPFLLIRAALPHMYANNFGRIINLSSVHGIRASPFKSAYVSAKHGLEGLSKVTALEGGEHGVTSNCINPGYVRTPLVESQIADQAKVHGIPESEVLSKIMLTEAAIKRLVEPEEVASLVAWLASDHAGMVTGASYTMDGGWSAR
jgi:3-hydroxybutyrate dehydrogenase